MKNRPEYLLRMKPGSLDQFGAALQKALTILQPIQVDLGNRQKGIMLERCIRRNLADVEMVRAFKL